MISVEIPLSGVRDAIFFVAGVSLAFGAFSALGPGRSIALYEWLMVRLNWRVAPIDEGREIRNTRWLGILLILLGLLVLGVLIQRRI